MKWRARLLGFLLICSLLIGLNVVATISGIYSPLPGNKDTAKALYRGADNFAAISQP